MSDSKVVICGVGKTVSRSVISKISETLRFNNISERDFGGDVVRPRRKIGRGEKCLQQWWDIPVTPAYSTKVRILNKDKFRRNMRWRYS